MGSDKGIQIGVSESSFRPLPKIVARAVAAPPDGDLLIGDTVNVLITPRSFYEKPFWRLYEVAVIDGDCCFMVTPDKQHRMRADTAATKTLRDLQRKLDAWPA